MSTSSITPAQARQALESGALVIDVRGDPGRQRDGLIDGAVVVAKADLAEALDLASPKKLPQLASLDQAVVLICTTEKGTEPYVAPLRQAGLKNLVHVDGGVAAWKEQGLPTTPIAG
ncbi:rhodanese-like domain-containing protein [Roseomonas sp. 18066]|uniref:rhodanese-like domain-containing protein n=1 Tax=Roseomonas sp. 18066 TaxID=2681412 RepID=UPI00135B06A7|nr:rhodanese-like domain-containing protein [Roseomonas sp. 18066]